MKDRGSVDVVVRGIRGALEATELDKIVLVLSDLQAAIAAVKNAGRRRKARMRHLVKVMQQVKARTDRLGPGAVRFAWVEAHISLPGNLNERADKLAKEGAGGEARRPGVAEGGLRQQWKKRDKERKLQRDGTGRVVRWNRKALVNYTRYRTGKGEALRKLGTD